MAEFGIAKVISTLPSPLAPDTVYAVRVGTGVELFVSDATGSIAYPLNPNVGNLGAFTGQLAHGLGSTPPDGWVVATGSIGTGDSPATNRGNLDTFELFTLLFNELTDSVSQIVDYTGTPTARSTYLSSTDAWVYNAAIFIPDLRGRILAALDDLGGTPAGIITVLGSNINATVRGTLGGAQNIAISSSQSGVPAHTHLVGASQQTNTQSGGASTRLVGPGSSVNLTAAANSPANAAAPHNNMPPVGITNLFVKL